MSKSFTSVTLLHGKEPLLRQATCEVRYQRGYLYLDHCGRLLNKLVGDGSVWVISPDPMPQGATAYNILTGTSLRFGSGSTALTMDRTSGDELIAVEEAAEFTKQIGEVLNTILDELEVTEFTRVGYREKYFFSFESKEAAEDWIAQLGLFNVAPALLDAFQAKPDAISMAVNAHGPNCRYRIAIGSLERPAQVPVGDTNVVVQASTASKEQRRILRETLKKQRQRQIDSAFSVMLDIDAFLLEPGECDVAAFASERASTNLPMFRDAVAKTTKESHP